MKMTVTSQVLEKLTISLFISSGYARQLKSDNCHKQKVKPVTRSSTIVEQQKLYSLFSKAVLRIVSCDAEHESEQAVRKLKGIEPDYFLFNDVQKHQAIYPLGIAQPSLKIC